MHGFPQNARVNVLVRIVGFHALTELAARLPRPIARLVSLALVLVSNLLPLVGVLAGWMSFADVFVLYWLETALLGLFAVVRIATATGDPRQTRASRLKTAAVFVLHFGSVVTLLGFIVAWMVGAAVDMGEQAAADGMTWFADPPTLGWGSWILAGVGMVLCHVWMLAAYWFGREERRLYSSWQCMWAPYPRVLVLYPFYAMNIWILVILVLFAPVLLVVLLVAMKTALDLVLFGLERLLAWRRRKTEAAALHEGVPAPATTGASAPPAG